MKGKFWFLIVFLLIVSLFAGAQMAGSVPDAPTVGGLHSLQFDGSDDFVSFPNDKDDFDFGEEFTLEAWIKPNSLVGSSFISILGGNMCEPPLCGGGWQLYLNASDHSDWGLSVCTPGCNAAGSGSGGLNTHSWQHIAGSYDGSQIMIYKDGILVNSVSQSGDVLNINYILMGLWSDSFDGWIDEVRVWDLARTQAEIEACKGHHLTGNDDGLVGYWRLDEGEGQVVADQSPRSNDGRLGASPNADSADPAWSSSNAPVGHIIDQYQPEKNYGFWFDDEVIRWQEFRPTLRSLNMLEVIIQKSGNPGDVIVEIQSEDGGSVLMQWVVDAADIPLSGWVQVSLCEPITLTPGAKYRIAVYAAEDSPSPANRYALRGSTTDSRYDSGCTNDVEGYGWTGFDYAFKTFGVPYEAIFLPLVTAN